MNKLLIGLLVGTVLGALDGANGLVHTGRSSSNYGNHLRFQCERPDCGGCRGNLRTQSKLCTIGGSIRFGSRLPTRVSRRVPAARLLFRDYPARKLRRSVGRLCHTEVWTASSRATDLIRLRFRASRL